MFRIMLKIQVNSKCLNTSLSANFCFLFSLFFMFHVACCSDHQWKYWLFFWVVVVICFKWSLNLTRNCWNLYLGVFSRSYSPVLQGINPDQIFLVCLWDCNTEYNKKKPQTVMLMFITSTASLLSISLQLCQRNKLCQFDTTLFLINPCHMFFIILLFLRCL